jgi:DNA-binding transcriptional ArsR family regulator
VAHFRLNSPVVRQTMVAVTPAEPPAPPDTVTAPLTADVHPARLDPVIHERLRLAIMCTLAVHASMPFLDLARHLGMTKGNLHIHAKRLEEVGHIQSTRHGDGRDTRTTFALTRAGRKALERYFVQLEAIIAATRRA